MHNVVSQKLFCHIARTNGLWRKRMHYLYWTHRIWTANTWCPTFDSCVHFVVINFLGTEWNESKYKPRQLLRRKNPSRCAQTRGQKRRRRISKFANHSQRKLDYDDVFTKPSIVCVLFAYSVPDTQTPWTSQRTLQRSTVDVWPERVCVFVSMDTNTRLITSCKEHVICAPYLS